MCGNASQHVLEEFQGMTAQGKAEEFQLMSEPLLEGILRWNRQIAWWLSGL